ncbi:Tyrosine--tRNA ligase [Terricaulis silvestris]|uniref:Tyrosine--tRNA ligase n=2 Tax=Terricaulis silvestris TaxID=2686094 RepID=A0A6I6MJN3_9CAUL|nr:Tyrosine--tRNA ligase [Terricaulis silvestris]
MHCVLHRAIRRPVMTTLADVRSDFLRAAIARGQFHQCTDLEGLDKAASAGVTGYIGFDMTAPSLHVGNLTQIMYLRRLQQAGGKPIVLLGGGTTRVGDPSGKEEMRQLLSEEQIAKNTASIKDTFSKFLTFGKGASDAILVDNAEWLMPLNYLDFLRTVGRYMSVNRMLSMDSVKLRLEREQPMSFIEFNYMILQAYDFVELKKRYGCSLQMGGSDQWGNIVNGVELGRRMESFELFGLTQPLITTASGAKMGKTAQGAVWLNADMVSPYDYWQYWRNCEDADVGRFLKIFTDLSLEEIVRLEALQGAEINDAKKVLATEATALLHGREEAEKAAGAAQATFEQGVRSDDLPTVDIPAAELNGLRVAAAFVRTGLVASNGEAKRHIAAGALRVNDVAVTDENASLSAADIVAGAIKLSLGKKKHALLKVS